MPITLLVLQLIKLHLNLEKFDDVMLWAACLTAFFGFLRASEFTVPPEGFNNSRHLAITDVMIDKHPSPDKVFIKLKFSKTDQFGRSCIVILARSSSSLCPVTALLQYLHLRGDANGPLFLWGNGSALTKSTLNNRLQSVLKKCGWPQTFTLHSFRVGAATTAASLGFPDYLIKALGRWSSEAYKVYIKIPQSQLIKASIALGTASN